MTCVCCNITSDIQTRYGVLDSRQGSCFLPCTPNQANNLSANVPVLGGTRTIPAQIEPAAVLRTNIIQVTPYNPSDNQLRSKHADLLRIAGANIGLAGCGLEENDLAVLRHVAQLPEKAWQGFVTDKTSDDLVSWIKVWVKLESDSSGFDVGSKSPVIPLFSQLRKRQEVPSDLVAWIRSNSQNRFLPYGSLADRLKAGT